MKTTYGLLLIFFDFHNEIIFFPNSSSLINLPPFIPFTPTKSVSQKLHFANFLSFSFPDYKLQPEKRQNTLGLPEKAPSPCKV